MRRSAALAMLLAGVFITGKAAAQRPAPQRGWEPRGFDFSPDGVWRRRAREVARLRRQAIARGDFALVNQAITIASGRQAVFAAPSQLGAAAATAVTGVLRVPTLLVRYTDTIPQSAFTPAAYADVLFDSVAPPARPYSVRTYYEEISNTLFSVQGVVVGWITLDTSEVYYTGGCYGILCGGGRVAEFISDAVLLADAGIDWSQFDNDGGGLPNDGNDDGYVDLLWLVHPTLGGECSGAVPSAKGMWAHRFFYEGWRLGPLATADDRAGTGKIRIGNYTLQSGLGGNGCDVDSLMAPGVTAHELGHGLGLPDLYDTGPDQSEGIGEWGLMGSGNWARPRSPAHMEAWSLAQLGWIALRPVSGNESVVLNPVQTSDEALLVRPGPGVANPRGEYFLLENRQALQSDTALIGKGKLPGLLVWHVDSAKIAQGTPFNTVNAGSIHGVWLLQADGLNTLRAANVQNRGDSGDAYPGRTGNTSLGALTAPASTLNAPGGAFSGLLVDSIRQAVPGGAMAFRVRFGGLTVVRASDTTAQVRVRDTAYAVFRGLFEDGQTATIAIDSAQLRNNGRTSLVFAGWSDTGLRAYLYTGTLAGDTVVATVAVRHQLDVATVGSGVVTTAAIPVAPSQFRNAGASVTLTATPGADQAFVGWSGDTAGMNPVMALPMARPYAVTATFVSTSALLAQFLTGGGGVTSEVVAALDANGNKNSTLDIGDLVAWLDATGAQPSAPLMRRLLERMMR